MFTNSRPRDPTNFRVKRAIALIQENPYQQVSLDRLAKEVNLSSSHLRHLFKAEVGLTPQQYAKFVRMNLAKELAATTFLSIKEIVYEIGVADQSHFLRDFKRAFGVTIGEYRATVTAKMANK